MFRSIAMASELNSDHKWLMESLSGMDLIIIYKEFSAAETEGDLGIAPSSAAPSVRFDDMGEDGIASDADSTESRFGSQENLLDPGPILSRNSSTSNGRSELMRHVHNDSIHSQDGVLSTRSSLVSDDEHQMTVMKREGNDREKGQLASLFNKPNDRGPS
uniref:Bestrophin homolog n=1 Tax=Heterorhabditis bacteriophora TaxID=37862 RepID=A0A1I7XDP8_HETBA